MKPFEIALFKHFLEDKGMTTVWINLYRKNHLPENPISIEEFLKNVSIENVFTKAFRFFVNSDYGFDYWSKMAVMWKDFVNANKDNYTANEWYKLTGMSKILRKNWDAAKHWKEETKVTAAIRLGIDLSLIGLQDKATTAQTTRLSEEFLRERTRREMDGIDLSSKQETKDDSKDKNAGSIFGEFELLSLRPKSHNSRRLKDDEASINTRDNRGRITFNQKISNEIKERGGYEYCSLLRNKKGDIILLFNDTDTSGATVIDGNARPNQNVCISSKMMVEKIIALLDIKNDYEIIKVTEVEKTDDYVAYLVTKLD